MMKQITKILLPALLLSLSVESKAQTPIDFETADYQKISVYDKWEHSPFRTGVLQGNVVVVANPNKNVDPILNKAPNTSDKVLGFQSSRFGSNIYGARVDLLKSWKTSPTIQYVHVMVQSPKEGYAMLVGLGKRSYRMEQSAETEQFWVRSLNMTQPGKWVDLVFPVKTANGVEVHSLVVVPYLDAPHTWKSDFLSYIDKIDINDSPLTLTNYADYALNIDQHATYTRGDRCLQNVQLGDKTFAVATEAKVGKTPAYMFITDSCFYVKPGDEVVPKIGYKGDWMDGYVYVDFDNDGRFSCDLSASGVPTPNSDLKSYSYYAAKGTTGTDSKGEEIKEGNHVVNNVITCPSFTIPKDVPVGFYRMRYKVDWNCVDAAGSIVPNNQILTNGGAFVDVRLNVHSDEVTITDANRNGDVLQTDGSPLGIKIPFNKSFTIKMRPENGFTYKGVIIRHGYNLDGDSLVHGTPQYMEVFIPKSQFGKDDTYTIPSRLIDGDVRVEGLFVSNLNEKKAEE